MAILRESDVARRVLDVLPLAMHRIRLEVHAVALQALSVSQFRVLANIAHGLDNVGQIARRHDVSQAAMSKMVAGLVNQRLVERMADVRDRRCVRLRLTAKGRDLYETVRRRVQRSISRRISQLTARERSQILDGLNQLEVLFGPDRNVGRRAGRSNR